ncbi:response regulator [Cohnella sp. GbtcB17]|uniref:response regulator n=1 Tax=Cohnella sp. GbtcB17 TaxID=2824762 RepID=UPI001C2F9CEB|nr:response regulator [Cohnella sp. GbtcB17]
MRIMIVDDETFFRTSFEKYIDWQSLGCEVVGLASNGQEALEAIGRLQPDLVFLDIQMPVMNGLEFLERYGGQKQKHKARIVVLSSFHEFEYVRQALRFGAADYIHKEEMGGELLARIIEQQSDAMQALRSSGSERPGPLASQAYLQKMLHDLDFEALDDGSSSPALSIRPGHLYVITMRFRQFPAIKQRYRGHEHRLYEGVQATMKEMLGGQKELECLFYDKRTFCMIKSFSDTASRLSMQTEIAYLAQKGVTGLRRFFNLQACVGVSRAHRSFRDLAQAAEEAIMAGMMEFTSAKDAVRYYSDMQHCRFVEHVSTDKLCRALETASPDDWMKLLQSGFYVDDAQAILSPAATAVAAKNIVCHFVASPDGRDRAFHQIEMAESRDEMLELLAQLLHRRHVVSTSKSDSGHPLIAAVRGIIHEHYAHAALSLEQIASQVNVSESYLSRIFRKEVGLTVTDYINRTRIDNALHLLEGGEDRIYQVAYAVGYSNVEHFNRTFKKLTGRSPGSFRARK